MGTIFDPYPGAITADETILDREPANPTAPVKLISKAYPQALAGQLSFTYGVPYELSSKEVDVYLVYDPKTASPADIEAWKAGEKRGVGLAVAGQKARRYRSA